MWILTSFYIKRMQKEEQLMDVCKLICRFPWFQKFTLTLLRHLGTELQADLFVAPEANVTNKFKRNVTIFL